MDPENLLSVESRKLYIFNQWQGSNILYLYRRKTL